MQIRKESVLLVRIRWSRNQALLIRAIDWIGAIMEKRKFLSNVEILENIEVLSNFKMIDEAESLVNLSLISYAVLLCSFCKQFKMIQSNRNYSWFIKGLIKNWII